MSTTLQTAPDVLESRLRAYRSLLSTSPSIQPNILAESVVLLQNDGLFPRFKRPHLPYDPLRVHARLMGAHKKANPQSPPDPRLVSVAVRILLGEIPASAMPRGMMQTFDTRIPAPIPQRFPPPPPPPQRAAAHRAANGPESGPPPRGPGAKPPDAPAASQRARSHSGPAASRQNVEEIRSTMPPAPPAVRSPPLDLAISPAAPLPPPPAPGVHRPPASPAFRDVLENAVQRRQSFAMALRRNLADEMATPVREHAPPPQPPASASTRPSDSAVRGKRARVKRFGR